MPLVDIDSSTINACHIVNRNVWPEIISPVRVEAGVQMEMIALGLLSNTITRSQGYRTFPGGQWSNVNFW